MNSTRLNFGDFANQTAFNNTLRNSPKQGDAEEASEDQFNYTRLAHFERSASIGFQSDPLGRLNEINKEQV